MFATQVLPGTSLEDQQKKEDNSEIVGFLKIGNDEHRIAKGDTKIGRDPAICSVVVDDSSVSILHAIIESEGPDDSFIYDVGSTNKTKLGKLCLKTNYRYKIDNGSVIKLGNVLAKFVVPPEYKLKATTPPNSGDNDLEKDSFDIFEVATQIEPVSSNDFQKPPDSFKLFKIPAQPKAVENCEPSTSFARPESPKVQYFYGADDSEIFNANTQCQLTSPGEGEKIRSLLNDGQDDVLCDFMLLHSPHSQTLIKGTEIKTEINTEIFEAETQAQLPETANIPVVEKVNQNLNNSKLEEKKTKKILEITLDDEEKEEDLIVTQVFPTTSSNVVESAKTVKAETSKAAQAQSLIVEESSDDDTVPYNVSLENCTQRNEDDDSVNTQVYDTENRDKRERKRSQELSPRLSSQNCTQRNQNDDVMSTQKFSLSNEENTKDQEEDLEVTQRINLPTANTTERSENDDLVSTQEFNLKSRTNNEREEDFVATQKLDLPKANSRETSPDLLSLSYSQREDEDLNSTQLFEKRPDVVAESSGDETESDLEIEAKEVKINIEFVESKDEESKVESVAGSSDTSNQSYVFQLDNDKDSDETDCEGYSRAEAQHSDLSNSSQKSLEVPPSQRIEKKPDGNEGKNSKYESSFDVQRLEVGVAAFVEKNTKRGRSNGNLLEVIPLKKARINRKDSLDDKLSKFLKNHERQGNRSDNSLLKSNPDKVQFAMPLARASTGGITKPKSESGKMNKFLSAKNVHDIPASQDFPMEPKFSENRVTRILRTRRSLIELPNPIEVGVKRRRSKREVQSKCVQVAFTGLENESLLDIITGLGGKKTNDLFSADVLVTDRVRRTVKFLCAIGLGMPITSPEWLIDCKKENKFVNPWNYILKKECAENGDFDLRTSLERSKKTKLFKGYNVFATENTKPPVKDLLTIVECCGGTPLYARPETWPKKTIFVSCIEDQESWPCESFRNVKLVHYEFILSGVLKQQIDFRTYKLS